MGEFGKVAYRRLTGELVRLSDGNDGLSEKQRGKSREVPISGAVLHPTAGHKLPVLLDLSEVRGTMLCEEMGESSHSISSSMD
jgi:E3 ubiquitin-protein ligase SHPRH